MKLTISIQNTAKSGLGSDASGMILPVYEVLRVIDGVALFLEDHYLRLQKTMELYQLQSEIGFQEFKGKINELIVLSQKQNGNIKTERIWFEHEILWEFSFFKPRYPDSEDYELGVKTDLYFAERENPNAKVVKSALREQINAFIETNHIYEVLLVDQQGQITEGSRSNVFFVQGKVFYTAPGSLVLIGITRQKVLECLNEMNCEVKEAAIRATELSSCDAAFITGTSPKVLPVNRIGDLKLNPAHPLVSDLMDRYNQKIDRYLREHK